MPTYYEVLGIAEGASMVDVRHAYRRLVKQSHPDVAGDTEQFRRIAEAYAVLSDPRRRAAYDRSLRRAPGGDHWAPVTRRRYGRYAAALVVALVVAGVSWLVVATIRQSVGDPCLVGTWRGEAFEVPFRGFLDGIEVSAPIRGGAGVILRVAADGTVRTDYTGAAPLTGTGGSYRIEGSYAGTTTEGWQADDGHIRQRGTDASGLRFEARINGRTPDQPLAATVLDGRYPYTCTPTTLDLGPYRYVRAPPV